MGMLVPRLVASGTLNRLGEGTASGSLLERYDLWKIGLKAWVQTPVLGTGAGSYPDLLGRAGEFRMVAHNTFVSVLVETGLVGFVLYFAFWLVVLRRVLLLPKEERFFWLGALACYMPSVLSSSAEYCKPMLAPGGDGVESFAAAEHGRREEGKDYPDLRSRAGDCARRVRAPPRPR